MRRGGALVLGGVVLGAAIVFASRPLGVVGLGLLAAGLVSRAWSALASGPIDVRAWLEPDRATEGDEVVLRFAARRRLRVPGGTAAITCAFDRLGDFECRLTGHGRSLSGEVALGALPRGRFLSTSTSIEVRDPLGLEVRSHPLGVVVGALVYPRLVDLESLWSDAGRRLDDGRRLLLRRTAGFDLHSVREYEQGESLRRVHWPSSAKRGLLMVKELEDAPRESVVVLLDCDPAGEAGDSPNSSFDVAVRAAGSIVRTHVARGRRVVLATTGTDAAVTRASTLEGDFQIRARHPCRCHCGCPARARPIPRAPAPGGDRRGRARRRDRNAGTVGRQAAARRCRTSAGIGRVGRRAELRRPGDQDGDRRAAPLVDRDPCGRCPRGGRTRPGARAPGTRGASRWVELSARHQLGPQGGRSRRWRCPPSPCPCPGSGSRIHA